MWDQRYREELNAYELKIKQYETDKASLEPLKREEEKSQELVRELTRELESLRGGKRSWRTVTSCRR